MTRIFLVVRPYCFRIVRCLPVERESAYLLLVDGDPLTHIEILQDRTALRMIMKDGALHKAPARTAG